MSAMIKIKPTAKAIVSARFCDFSTFRIIFGFLGTMLFHPKSKRFLSHPVLFFS